MIKKNTSLPGFQIGHFLGTADGLPVVTGTPTCKRLLDGTPGTLTNAASYDATAGVWKIDLAAADVNADFVGLVFTLAACLPISYGIRTSSKLVSELVDAAAAPAASVVASQVRTELTTELGRMDVTVGSRATQTSVDDLPTNTELATALSTADDAILAVLTAMKGAGWSTETLVAIDVLLDAIKAKTDLMDTSAITVATAVDGGAITGKRWVTLDAPLTGLTIPATWTRGFFTVKVSKNDTDAEAILQVMVTNPADAVNDGMQYLNAATALDKTDGSLALDAALGTAAIVVSDEAMGALAERSGLVWDIKVNISTTSRSTQIVAGTFDMDSAVTRQV